MWEVPSRSGQPTCQHALSHIQLARDRVETPVARMGSWCHIPLAQRLGIHDDNGAAAPPSSSSHRMPDEPTHGQTVGDDGSNIDVEQRGLRAEPGLDVATTSQRPAKVASLERYDRGRIGLPEQSDHVTI